MKKGIALCCTVFILLSSGYAQSNRVGVYVTPQYSFFKQKSDPNNVVKGKGFLFSTGAYYETNWGVCGVSFGLGYSQLNTTFSEITQKKRFGSLPIGVAYEFDIADNFFLGIQATIGINYLVSEKQVVDGIEVPAELGKRLYFSYGGGLSFTYLFSDAIGLSIMPTFLGISAFDPAAQLYLGVGGQIRFFYAFGY